MSIGLPFMCVASVQELKASYVNWNVTCLALTVQLSRVCQSAHSPDAKYLKPNFHL